MLLLMIRPARPSLAEVPVADLSFQRLLGCLPERLAQLRRVDAVQAHLELPLVVG